MSQLFICQKRKRLGEIDASTKKMSENPHDFKK